MLARFLFLLQNTGHTVGIENVTTSRIALCYYAVIRDCHFDVSVSSHVRYVTCSHEQIVTQSPGLVEFTVSKWLTLTQFHLFTHSLIEKRNYAMGNPTRSRKNEPFGCKYLLL